MENLNMYIRTVGVFLIFTAFAEIIIPDGSFKKFISLILGLLMLATVLEPLGNIFKRGVFDFSYLIKEQENKLAQSFNIDKDFFESPQEFDMTMDIYKIEMEKLIRENLKNENINVAYVNIKELMQDGSISLVEVGLLENGGLIDAVEPVNISSEKPYDEIENSEKKEIYNIIGEKYGIAYEQLEVKVN